MKDAAAYDYKGGVTNVVEKVKGATVKEQRDIMVGDLRSKLGGLVKMNKNELTNTQEENVIDETQAQS